MIPASLRELLDATHGQRQAQWAGRTLWLANEAWGELAVSLQGAQVLHFLAASDAMRQPFESASDATRTDTSSVADTAPPLDMLCPGGWLWTTPTPAPLPKAIRGGIPLCWPWFADEHSADETPDLSGPSHGNARAAPWRLDAVDDHAEGVELHMSPQAPLHSQLAPRVVIQANAQRLHLELVTEHVGDTPVKLTAALHSYLAVADSTRCRVEGLAGARYLDKLSGFSEGTQQGEAGVRGAIDRIFESNRELVLDDGKRRLRIAKQGSDSTVVWHPGDDLPQDTPAEAARHFLCVEAACTRLDPVWLVPGAQHLLGTTLSCEANALACEVNATTEPTR